MQPGTFVWAAFRDEPESFVNFSCINFKWRAEWYPETMKFVLYNKTIESPAKKIYRMTCSLKISVVDPCTRQKRVILHLPAAHFSEEFPNYFVTVKNFMTKEDLDVYCAIDQICGFVISFDDPLRFQQLPYLVSLNQKLLTSALVDGDVVVNCKNDEVVKADRIVLIQDPFFESLFDFRSNQNPKDEDLSVDLVEFPAFAVEKLVRFLYTGTYEKLLTLDDNLQIFQLANYTTNIDLAELVLRVINEQYFDFKDLGIIIRSNAFRSQAIRELVDKYLIKF